MHRNNLLSLFAEFGRHSNGVAIVQRRGYRRETWTYAKLSQLAVKCAFSLREYGIQTGDRVLIWGPNSAEWMAAFWGCLLRGAVAVPMDIGATLEFTSRVANDAGVKFLFATRGKTLANSVIQSLVLEDLPDTLSSIPVQNCSPKYLKT